MTAGQPPSSNVPMSSIDRGTDRNGVDTSTPAQEFTLTVTPVNDAPVNTINGSDDFAANAQSTDDNVDLPFTALNGNLLKVTDVDDDGSPTYTLDLTANRGTLLFGQGDTPEAAKSLGPDTLVNINVVDKTQFGNPEGMVTWVAKPDGSFDYDYSVFDRYIALAKEIDPDNPYLESDLELD